MSGYSYIQCCNNEKPKFLKNCENTQYPDVECFQIELAKIEKAIDNLTQIVKRYGEK